MRLFLSTFCALACASLSAFSQASAPPRVEKAIPVARAAAATDAATPEMLGNSTSVVLRANDLFELRLSGMPPEDAQQFSGAPYTVGSDGMVSFPLIAKIRAAGRTPGDLERAIENELKARKIFRWPNATVTMVTSMRFVTVGGQVRNPNRMPWSADLTLLSAISAASGPGDFAGDKINLTRAAKTTTYSKKKLKRNPELDPKLQPGDNIDHL